MTPQMQIAPEDVLVRAQETPNPSAIKFIVNYALKSVGNATFKSKEEAYELPLVASLFDIPGVKQVYVFQNTLTVTHTEELPDSILKDSGTSIIKSRMPVHNPEFSSPEEIERSKKPDRSSLSPERIEVEEILDRTIRPGLQSDGGDIEVVDFKDNTIKIIYQGACGGCPSAMMGTLDAIQSILRNELKNDELVVEPL